MAGHDLLPGCTHPWRHDECSGYQPSPVPGGFGGMVCHCPCHGLRRRIAELEAAAPDQRKLRDALPGWLDRIVPSCREFIAWTVGQDWPKARPPDA